MLQLGIYLIVYSHFSGQKTNMILTLVASFLKIAARSWASLDKVVFYWEWICSGSLRSRRLWTLRLFELWWWLVGCEQPVICVLCALCISLLPPLGFGASSGFGCGTTGASTFGFGTTDKPSGSLSAGLCASAWVAGRWKSTNHVTKDDTRSYSQ